MSEFNFKSQICTDKNQSERLLALGLKKETADCALFLNGNNEFEQLSKFGNWEKYADMFPAWGLHRLIEIIHLDIQTDGVYVSLYDFGFTQYKNLYDNLISCIEWLIKKGYFNKEYLV